MSHPITHNICILASEGISKESLENNFVNRISKEDYKVTLGVDLPVKTLKQKIDLQFLIYHYDLLKKVQNWEEFVSENISGSKGIVIMFDEANAETLSWVSRRIQIIKENLDYVPPILLVGNKADLEENQDISEEQIAQFKKNNELSSSMEISLKTGENVEKAFIKLTEMMIGKTKTDYRVEMKRLTFLKENKRLAILLFISIFAITLLLSWFMYYLIYVI